MTEPHRPLPHGGRLAAARAMFPDAPEPFIDLSTGINPVPYPVPALSPTSFTRLPEPESLAALEAAAAAAYAVADPDLVVAAPGTQSLIGVLPRLVPPCRVAVLAPTYGEHLAVWRAAGHDAREVTDLAACPPASVVVVVNPNNPDGRRLPPARLLELARGLAARDGLLVVDEAFADFEPALSLAPTLPHPGLIVLRSFGKAYGLAGLRLGFALTSGPLLAPLRAVLGPWPVCGPAVEVGATALRDAAWRAAAGHRLARDAAALDAVLMAAGLAIVGGTSLFRLARHPRAADILTRLGQRGLLARPFPEHPDWLRFGVPASPEVLARLERALASHAG